MARPFARFCSKELSTGAPRLRTTLTERGSRGISRIAFRFTAGLVRNALVVLGSSCGSRSGAAVPTFARIVSQGRQQRQQSSPVPARRIIPSIALRNALRIALRNKPITVRGIAPRNTNWDIRAFVNSGVFFILRKGDIAKGIEIYRYLY